MTLSGGANGEPCDGNSSGVLAVDGLRNESAGRFYLNTAGSGFSSPWRIGASGLTASNGSGGFVVKPQRPATLNAMANYSIAAPIAVSNTLYVGTTCATSSVPRTVTVAAQLSGTGSLAVTGAGTLRLTKDCGLAGGIAVTNSATLRVDEGVKSVAGNLSLGTGTAVYIGTPSGVPARLAVADAAIGNGVAVRLGSTIVKRGVYPVLTKTGGGSFTQADLAKLSLDCSAVPELAGVAHLVLGGTGNDSICISTLRHGVWVGGNGNFGDAANWEDGVVPSVGDALFFNEIASNVKVSAPSSSRAVKYGVATMGGKVVTFSGNIAFAGISDTSKVSVDANATVTLDGDLVFANATSGANNYIVNTVGANGAFVVTGRIVSSADGFGYVLPSVNAGDGVIVAKGLVQNSSNSDNPSFRLARDAGSTTRWAIGRDGITGSKNYWILNNNNHPRAEIRPLDSDFTISAKIGNREKATLVLDTTGRDGLAHTIKLTGGTYREGVNIVKGTGKVVCDYIAPSGNASNKFSVEGSATLVLKAGSNIGSGKVTVNAGATLLAENAAGGSITLPALEITAGGTLAVLNGGSAPAIKATSFKVLAGASGAKVSVIIGNGTVGAGTYTVLSASSITANAGDFLLANVASGCTASFSKSGNSLVVTVASSGSTPKSFVENVNAAPVAALSESQRRARVLNLDLTKADATGEVTIKAIRVDGKKVEVDVVLERRGAVQKDGVDAPINGVLKLYAVDLATGGQTLVAGAQVDDPTFANGDTATFTFETSVPAGFYKAVIDEE
jgi:hypothetical protein